jgi:phospholipid/cholesterol/gamma-HCH transport system ATP-binding protein
MAVGAPPLLRFEGIAKSFGAKKVLQGLDLDVFEGETIVVLGGSGTGKSVLLRHAIGLMRPDAGSVYFEGHPIQDMDEDELIPIRKKFGMLFQGGALFDSMSVFENVAFALREHLDLEEDEVEARVRKNLDLVELEEIEDLMPSSLSGGMRKRVALARAIALEPSTILYDEPTTGLDPITANSINRLIRSMQRKLGVTSVVVTHDILSASMVADRIAFLDQGKIRFLGTFSQAMESEDRMVRTFISEGILR